MPREFIASYALLMAAVADATKPAGVVRTMALPARGLTPQATVASERGREAAQRSRRESHLVRRRSATVQFTAAAAYPARQEAVRHLSNSRDWLIFFQIFLYKPV